MNIGGRESVREGYLLRKILYEGGIAVDKDTSGTIRRAEHFQVALIGEGIHERFIIDKEKFMKKAEGKK